MANWYDDPSKKAMEDLLRQQRQPHEDLLRQQRQPYEDFLRQQQQPYEDLLRQQRQVEDILRQQRQVEDDLRRQAEQIGILSGASRSYFDQTRDPYTQALKAFGPALNHDISLLGSALQNETTAISTAAQAARYLQEYESRFRTPQQSDVDAVVKLMCGAQADAALVGAYGTSAEQVLRGLHSPWVNQTDIARSVAGMVELSAIGSALHNAAPFDSDFTDMLRADLGDWRRVKTWPERIFDNPVARLAFYEERGFNAALTDFPSAAFDEALVVTGIRPQREPEEEVGEEVDDAAPSVGDILVAPATNVTAYNYLFTFEQQVRRLIVTEMERLEGPEWFKRRVPSQTLLQWQEKKATDQKNGGQDRPLIEYADFTDYLPIIERRDNWKDAFGAIFGHKPSLQESFRRLYAPRLSTMHARTLLQTDEIYVYVEVHRLLSAMRNAGRG